jgi:hypothetical protein
VVELVDASDSKSEEPCACGGSSPPSGTMMNPWFARYSLKLLSSENL